MKKCPEIKHSLFTVLLAVVFMLSVSDSIFAQDIKIGSKKFTESVILGEIISQLAQSAGASAEYKKELGGTRVLWNALVNGDIDIYPEYTGTIAEEIFSGNVQNNEDAIRDELSKHGIKMTNPLGFNNTYALGVKKETAARYNLKKISGLRNHPGLKFGFTNEFMDRKDGWPSLRSRYELPQKDVRGLDHDLAYRGLESQSIHLIDLYSTDAEIEYYDLFILEDDLEHFTEYNAVILYRAGLEDRAPDVVSAIKKLEGRISAAEIRAMNAKAKIDKVNENRITSDFLSAELSVQVEIAETGYFSRLLQYTYEHLILVFVSLSAAIVFSIPLGIISAKFAKTGQAILGVVGILQTIPSLALLVLMIPVFGIGWQPAIAALFLYSLLPIVRNTHAGLQDIPVELTESAIALGLPARQASADRTADGVPVDTCWNKDFRRNKHRNRDSRRADRRGRIRPADTYGNSARRYRAYSSRSGTGGVISAAVSGNV